MWQYSYDIDTKGRPGYRIDSPEISLLAWVPIGYGDSDAEQTAKLICDAVNQRLGF